MTRNRPGENPRIRKAKPLWTAVTVSRNTHTVQGHPPEARWGRDTSTQPPKTHSHRSHALPADGRFDWFARPPARYFSTEETHSEPGVRAPSEGVERTGTRPGRMPGACVARKSASVQTASRAAGGKGTRTQRGSRKERRPRSLLQGPGPRGAHRSTAAGEAPEGAPPLAHLAQPKVSPHGAPLYPGSRGGQRGGGAGGERAPTPHDSRYL
jgi:hypothetical protein